MNNKIINDAKPNGQTFAQSAAAYTAGGLSVLPTCADKRPALPWKKFTQRIITPDEIAAAEFPTIRAHRTKNQNEEQGGGIECRAEGDRRMRFGRTCTRRRTRVRRAVQ